MKLLSNQRSLFHIDENITYLNCANMAPMLRSVKEAGLQTMEERAKPWKLTAADWFTNGEILRELAANIFQTNANNIAFIPSASYGLALAAKNLSVPAGKEIIVLENQFPSNYYVWKEMADKKGLKLIAVPKTPERTLTENILANISERTGLVSLPNCHWIDGTWIDLEKISDAVRSVGAYLVLDLSQSLGALPIDIERIQPDFAVSVGYKWMMGPYSLGYLYASPKWQQQGEPLEYSWLIRKGSDDFASLTLYEDEYREGARRFDMGEYSHLNLMPMAIAALKQINEWGVANIQSTARSLTDLILQYKKENGLINGNDINAGHLIGIPLTNTDPAKVKQKLQENNVSISFRSSVSIRVAPHLYNDANDIRKLLSCLVS